MTSWAGPRRLARGLLALAILLLALPGCGRKGPPVAPRLVAPAAPSPVRAELEDGAIVVTWARPTRNEDGTPLANLQEFRLYRAVSQGTPRPTGPQPAFSLVATVQADHPDNATVMGDLYAFRDEGGGRELIPGTRYIYRLQAVNRRGTAGPPSVATTVDFFFPPPPPTTLTAVARNGVVDLAWQEPALSPPGASVLRGYNVYRGTEPGHYGPEPVNGRLIQETRYQDPGVESDVTYYYMVRSVGSERPPWLESGDSNEVAVTSIDVTPPAPPQGLVAVPGPSSIGLSWRENTEPDLLGYLMYRREPPELAPTRLTPTPIQATTFTDRTVRPGATYVYWVTAVDRSPRHNESAPSVEVTAALP